jgi:hypothetical protein
MKKSGAGVSVRKPGRGAGKGGQRAEIPGKSPGLSVFGHFERAAPKRSPFIRISIDFCRFYLLSFTLFTSDHAE